ncbi:MAG: glycerophosphodiester phosphodiesterase [Deltaproteobacteria bacterium]|nr:glycerophosphodiester phosphodiesterase [Myxococcales bacterium]MDP3217247.1 glycerophosphodiester phosphodiesterase [Deltaproteobacteria bacterium]
MTRSPTSPSRTAPDAGRRLRLVALCVGLLQSSCGTVALAPDASASLDASRDAPPVDAPRRPCVPGDNVLLCGAPLLIAHRGGGALRPEETLPAFANAAALHADVLELDVHTTADGEVVCIHDATVDRTTNGTGAVRGLTFAELRALDAGYRFTTDGGATFPYRGRGITVPRLAEVLAAHPTAWFSIEIKQLEPGIVDAVLAVVDASGAASRVVLVSFHDAVVREIRARRPGLVTGMSLGEFVAFARLRPGAEESYAPPTTISQLPADSVTAEVVARAERFGVRLHAWTVNDRAAMERLLDLGVHGIMTDDPALLADVLARR